MDGAWSVAGRGRWPVLAHGRLARPRSGCEPNNCREAHLAEGNVAEPLRHYEFFRDLIGATLGIEPSSRLGEILPAAAPRYLPTTDPHGPLPIPAGSRHAE
jgi:hypothetical protein